MCGLCLTTYHDPSGHIATDVHLEAMAEASIREWIALPASDQSALGFAKQIARLERVYSYDDWRRSIGLPDTDETLLVYRRMSWVWIKAIGLPDYEDRLAYAREALELELKGGKA